MRNWCDEELVMEESVRKRRRGKQKMFVNQEREQMGERKK
jgi:hypothetical protein